MVSGDFTVSLRYMYSKMELSSKKGRDWSVNYN